MRRAIAVLLLLVVAACSGGNTPAEDAYLAELQERGSQVELDDPDQKLTDGHSACDMIADTKPDKRDVFAYLLEQRPPYSRDIVSSALIHLCPEVGVKRY